MGCNRKRELAYKRQITAAPVTITLPGSPRGPSGVLNGEPSLQASRSKNIVGDQVTYHPLEHNGGLIDCIGEGDVRACHRPLIHTATVS